MHHMRSKTREHLAGRKTAEMPEIWLGARAEREGVLRRGLTSHSPTVRHVQSGSLMTDDQTDFCLPASFWARSRFLILTEKTIWNVARIA